MQEGLLVIETCEVSRREVEDVVRHISPLNLPRR